jgi:hypothetical protein
MTASSILLIALLAADPTPAPKVSETPAVPWSSWFAKNTMVTDKKSYVHFFWNAQDVREKFEGPAKKELVARAAWELVRSLYPAKASADLAKIDIVFVRERDSYGLPKWESLERVAHVELSREKVAAAMASGAPPARLVSLCERIDLF